MTGLLDKIDDGLIKKYNVSGPYYSSYPVLSEWSDRFSHVDYEKSLNRLCLDKAEAPFFLYLHFPFCAKQCYYCICNSISVYKRAATKEYLDHVVREIELFREFFKRHSFRPKFKKIHLGGGTPNLMDEDEFEYFLKHVYSLVDRDGLNEFAMEIDPRTVSMDKLLYYSQMGINRLSFGIQDFDPAVQKAINRIQPFETVERLLTPRIRGLFKSINFDILYGLPLQTNESFNATMEKVEKLSPDRITFIKYAHIPERKQHQKMIRVEDLPGYIEGARIFIETTERLLADGYEHIGIDHFARPDDDLARAVKTKTVWRNFIGVTPGGWHETIGIGPTSTSSFEDCYGQNVYDLPEYYAAVSSGKFPILRGYELKRDDMIRRQVINGIICDHALNFNDIGKRCGVEFKNYFREEMNGLKEFIDNEMIVSDENSFKITSLGVIFIRHVCKVFDKYLKTGKAYEVSGP